MRGLRLQPAQMYGLVLQDPPKLLSGIPVSVRSRLPTAGLRALMGSIPSSGNLTGKIYQAVGLSFKRDWSGETHVNPAEAEESIEKSIVFVSGMTGFSTYCRRFTGAGSVLCFIKLLGCNYVIDAFLEYFSGGGKIVLLLVEAIEIILMAAQNHAPLRNLQHINVPRRLPLGTVMLVFGMGLNELFVSTFDVTRPHSLSFIEERSFAGSNLFGMFKLMERPKSLGM